MSRSWYEMLQEFHKACGTNDPTRPSIPDVPKKALRMKLIEEEYEELMGNNDFPPQIGALEEDNLENIAKELCDLIYVLIGCGLAYGINMDKAFAEVHKSNMTKFPKNGEPLNRRPDGKVMKPSTYKPADMGKVIWDYEDDTSSEHYPSSNIFGNGPINIA